MLPASQPRSSARPSNQSGFKQPMARVYRPKITFSGTQESRDVEGFTLSPPPQTTPINAKNQISTCVPISTTRPVGIWKYSVASDELPASAI